MKTLTFIIALLLSFSTIAQIKHTVTQSSVTYQIKNMGINTTGTFGGLTADISFDKLRPDSAVITASIDVATINSDNAMRDKHLRSADYFDAEKYPKITMQSVSIRSDGGDNYTGVFNLTIKDTTRQITLPFTYTENEHAGNFSGGLSIRRMDYGIGKKGIMMANDVKILLSVQTSF